MHRRLQTRIEMPKVSSGMAALTRLDHLHLQYTTSCGVVSQPDRHKRFILPLYFPHRPPPRLWAHSRFCSPSVVRRTVRAWALAPTVRHGPRHTVRSDGGQQLRMAVRDGGSGSSSDKCLDFGRDHASAYKSRHAFPLRDHESLPHAAALVQRHPAGSTPIR